MRPNYSRGLGLTLEDIAVLREWYAKKLASTSRSD
jgi:hypothetical protein